MQPQALAVRHAHTFNIAACALKDYKKLDSFDSIDDLIEGLVGKSFISVVKTRGKYSGITWDMVYVDTAAEEDEDFDDLPYEPKAPF